MLFVNLAVTHFVPNFFVTCHNVSVNTLFWMVPVSLLSETCIYMCVALCGLEESGVRKPLWQSAADELPPVRVSQPYGFWCSSMIGPASAG